ncbi:MAG: ABC transporter permease [Steroidobacteraceae bacterium]
MSVLSIVHGFQSTLGRAADPDGAMVLRSGSRDEISSGLSRDTVRIVKEAPGIRRGVDGPHASAELVEMITLPRASTTTAANVAVRGLEPIGFALRGDIRIIEGRRFALARRELIVGRSAQRQFAGLEIGRTVMWGTDPWVVTGVFDARGSIAESEIWCDVGVLQAAFRKEGIVGALHVRLTSPGAFAEFRDALTSDPRLSVAVLRERDYYAQQSIATSQLVSTVGLGIVGLMAMGAVFCTVNTMYTAVAGRTREIATLRALGFGSTAVVFSVLVESALLAFVGGTVGGLAAWGLLDGYQTSTLNWNSFSQVVFAFAVTPKLVATGVLSAVVIGLVGGILPAMRATRVPVASALREL